MFHYLLVFRDRSESQGAGIRDEDLISADGLYFHRVQTDVVIDGSKLAGWCMAYAGIWRPLNRFMLIAPNLAGYTKEEVNASVKKVLEMQPKIHTVEV